MNFYEWFSVMKQNWKKLLFSLIILTAALTAYGISGDYVSENFNSVAAPDLILDHIGPYNLNFLFVWLILIVIALFFVYPLIAHPKKFPYIVNLFSLFVFVRSFFIIFTHLKVPYDAAVTSFPSFLQILNFSNDLFFSGHAGLPFLGFLIFRKKNKKLGYVMLFCSIALGIVVLLMHVHYSIDVFSAYFITYGTYKFGDRVFRKI